MRLSRLKRTYLRTHFREFGDAQIARALAVEKADIKEALEQLGLTRTPEEDKYCRDRGNIQPPPFDGQLPRPRDSFPFVRLDYVLAAATWLATMAVYWQTLGPTITGEDSGELVTAAYALGIAHPPGYPIWCLLGKVFTFIPYGTVAWRVNLMSAYFGATTVCLVCLLAIRLTRSRLAGITASLALAFSAEFWEQSVIAEVYSLNAFFIVLCCLLLVKWYETRQKPFLLAFAFTYGLSLTNHNTMNLLGPAFLLFVFFIDREPWRHWRLYAACLGVSLLPLSVYAYLPIRSLANPPVDWGNPETLANFWDVVTRKQYAFGFTKNPRTLGRFAVQTWAFIKLYGNEFTPWLAWVPVAGAVALWRRNRLYCASLLAFFLHTVFGFIILLNFDIEKESLWLNNVFWIPAYIVAAVFIGAAVSWMGGLTIGSRKALVPAIVASGVCIAVPFAANYHKNDKGNYYFAYDFGMNVLKTLEQDAIYIPAADHATFPTIYLQAVEGIRRDVSIGNKYGYPEVCLYEDMPEDQRRGFRKIPTEAEEAMIEDWIVSNTNRPVYFSKKRSFPSLPDVRVVDTGLLFRVVKANEVYEPRDWWQEYEWHTLEPADTRGDLTAEFVLSDYNFFRGRDYLAAGDKEKGLDSFELALKIGGESKESLNNIGSACAEAGQLDEAAGYYARTLKLDPDYDFALRNLAKIYMQKEQWDQSLALFDRVLKRRPFDSEATMLSAQCMKHGGRVRDALDRLQEYTQIFPNDPKVFREMGFIYFNDIGDQQTAQRMFARSLALDPGQPELAMLVNQPGTAASTAKDDPFGTFMPDLPKLPGLEPMVPELPRPALPDVTPESVQRPSAPGG